MGKRLFEPIQKIETYEICFDFSLSSCRCGKREDEFVRRQSFLLIGEAMGKEMLKPMK